jgi:hypothetical protein
MYNKADFRHRYMIFSMTNSADCNEVMAIHQGAYDNLSFVKSYETGGNGTGEQTVDPLMSQGSIILSEDRRFLFVVNAGSNSITSFGITNSGALILADVKQSGGFFPISLATHGDLLYVANRGNGSSIASNVTGFYVEENGSLTQISGSDKPLSSKNAQPSCIVINNNGTKIAVSELNTDLISVYCTQPDGTLTGPITSKSSGTAPFGSVFLTNEILLVTEAGTNALSSYSVNHNGALSEISPSVLNYQTATCWVVLSQSGRFAYTSLR